MIAKLFATSANRWDLAILRIGLAVVLWPHGAQKMLGWFGGYGFAGTTGFFVETLGMPWALGVLVILIEFVGPLLLVVGLGSRIVAAGIAAVMAGAVTMGGHLQHGFFMNWFGTQKGEGFEFHLLALAMCAAVGIAGGGAGSLDGWVARWLGGEAVHLRFLAAFSGVRTRATRLGVTLLVVSSGGTACIGNQPGGVSGAGTFAKSYGGPGNDVAADVTALSGGGFAFVGHGTIDSLRDVERCQGGSLTGCRETMIWVNRLDALGNIEWSHGFHQPGDRRHRGGVAVGDGTAWRYGDNGQRLFASRYEIETGVTIAEHFGEIRQPRRNCAYPERVPKGTIVDAAAGDDGSLWALSATLGAYDLRPGRAGCAPVEHRNLYLSRIRPDGTLAWLELVDSVPGNRLEYLVPSEFLVARGDRAFVVGQRREGGDLNSGDIVLAGYRRDRLRLWKQVYEDYFNLDANPKLVDRDGDGVEDMLIAGGKEVDCERGTSIRDIFCFDDDDGDVAAFDLDSGDQVWRRVMDDTTTVHALTASCELPGAPCSVLTFSRDEDPGAERMRLHDARTGEVLRQEQVRIGGGYAVEARPHPDLPGFEAIFGYRERGGGELLVSFGPNLGQLSSEPVVDGRIDFSEPIGRFLQADYLFGRSVAEVQDGGLAVLGTAARSTGQRLVPWLAKLDRFGRVQWRKSLDGMRVSSKGARDIVRGHELVASGDQLILFAEHDRGDAVVALDEDGALRWVTSLNLGTEPFYALNHSLVEETADGGVVVASTESGIVARLDRSGEVSHAWAIEPIGGARVAPVDLVRSARTMWILSYGTPINISAIADMNSEGAVDSAYETTGLVLIAYDLDRHSVAFARKLSFGQGGRLGRVAHDDVALAAAPEGGVWVAATARARDHEGGSNNVLAARLAGDGELLHAAVYGGAGAEIVTAADSTADGGVVISAVSDSLGEEDDAWLLRLGPDAGISMDCVASLELVSTDTPFSSQLVEGGSILSVVDPTTLLRDRPTDLGTSDFDLPEFELEEIAEARQCVGAATADEPYTEPEVVTLGVRGLGPRPWSYRITPELPLACDDELCRGEAPVGTRFEIRIDPENEPRLRYVHGCEFELGRCAVTLEASREVVLAFGTGDVPPAETRTVTFEIVGRGRLSVVSRDFVCEGIDTTCTDQVPLDEGLTVRAEAETGWSFAGWERCDGVAADDACELAGGSNETARAQFTVDDPVPGDTRIVTFETVGDGNLVIFALDYACSGADRRCVEELPIDDAVNVVAVPRNGWDFAGWERCDGTENGTTCALPGGADEVVRGRFVLAAGLTLIAEVVPQGRGELLVVTPGGGRCGTDNDCVINDVRPGESYVLSATPRAGFRFSEWGGACAGGDSPMTLTIDPQQADPRGRIRCDAHFVRVN